MSPSTNVFDCRRSLSSQLEWVETSTTCVCFFALLLSHWTVLSDAQSTRQKFVVTWARNAQLWHCPKAWRRVSKCKAHFPNFISADWPPYSPDLNPMDYSIWSILEGRACAKPHKNLEALKQPLQRGWDRMSAAVKCMLNYDVQWNACWTTTCSEMHAELQRHSSYYIPTISVQQRAVKGMLNYRDIPVTT